MFKLEFTTCNAAFDGDNKEYEVADILKDVAEKIMAGYDKGKIIDVNGNNVGTWSLD